MLIVIETFTRPELPFIWLLGALTLALVPTVLWRRTRPLPMLAISFVVTAFMTVLVGPDNQLFSGVFLIVLAYSVFRWGSGRAALGGFALLAGISLVSTLTSQKDVGGLVGDIIGGLLVTAAVVGIAFAFRSRATARAREVEQARSSEREHLARDLHDTVAHHVSAIAIQAQAGLATASSDPSAAVAALRVIEKEASRTLAEMRSMVRVLRRDDSVDLAPAATVADVRSLASTDTGGPVVTVQLSGDVEGVPSAVAAAIYRIAQESVTNARRHARHATRVNVIVEASDTSVTLTVRDNGEASTSTGSGYGITGMTERAALLGGTFEAGRGPRGWTVKAVLPRSGWAR